MDTSGVKTKTAGINSNLLTLPFRIEELKLTIDAIDQKDLKELATYVSKWFFKDEPLSTYYPHDMYEYELLLKQCNDINLCLALRNDAHEIVGAFVGDSFQIEQHPETVGEPPVASTAILDTFDDVYREFYDKNHLTGRVARMYGVHVNPELRGKSFAGILLHCFAISAIRAGYSQAFGVCTNRFSFQRIKEAGLKPVKSIKYDEYEYQGKKPFVDMDKIFTKKINAAIGKEKFTTTAAEATMVYGSLDEIIHTTSQGLIH